MSDSPVNDPLYEYRQQQRENYEGRNNYTRFSPYQDDVYTTVQSTERNSSYRAHGGVIGGNGFFSGMFAMLRDKTSRLSHFLVPNYATFTTSESISTFLFFTVLGFGLFFLILSLF